MKKLILSILLTVCGLYGQASLPVGSGTQSQPFTVTTLPDASSNSGAIYWVKDATSLTVLGSGGGSQLVPVKAASSVWTILSVGAAAGAPLASPAFTGTPTAPTPTLGTNSTQLATTAFVASTVSGLGSSSSSTSSGTPPSESAKVTLSGGSYTYTYVKSYNVAPVCTATDQTANASVKVVPSLTTAVLTGTSTDVISLNCHGIATISYYADPVNGNDIWSGLYPVVQPGGADGPVKTITAAQTLLRSGSGIRAVRLRAGTYTMAANLAFTYSDNGETWMSYPNETPVIAGGGTYTITITGVNPISFYGLTLSSLGAGGVIYSGGTNTTWRWNTWLNCLQFCISGSSMNTSLIDSNTVNGQSPGNPSGSTGSAYQVFTITYGSSNNKITHNLIQNAQGGGIAIIDGTSDPANNSNVVDRNVLLNVDTSVVDMGALYTYDASHAGTGNQFTNNLVYGNGGGVTNNQSKCVYLDSSASYVTVTGNICAGGVGAYGLQIHNGDHNVVSNNIFDLTGGSQLGFYQVDPTVTDYGMAGNTFQKNLVYSSSTYPSSLWTVNVNAGDAAVSDSNNLYYSVTGATIPNTGEVDSSRVLQNPQFNNVATKQFYMPSSSPAYGTVGFSALPTNQGPLPPNIY